MEELRERLAEIADLERVSMLLAWDQEVCMPPAGSEARGEMRATVGRLAHERFTDERVGALLAQAAPRDELEADIVRVAKRDFDKACASPASSWPMARAGVAARGAWLGARDQRLHALRRPGATSAAPALQRVLCEHPYDPRSTTEPG
jgi:carboxypeptidase Taq